MDRSLRANPADTGLEMLSIRDEASVAEYETFKDRSSGLREKIQRPGRRNSHRQFKWPKRKIVGNRQGTVFRMRGGVTLPADGKRIRLPGRNEFECGGGIFIRLWPRRRIVTVSSADVDSSRMNP